MPLHRFIVKPAFQFEIQFNSMARAIIYVDSTLIVYCFRPAPLYVCVRIFPSSSPSSFILLPKDCTISVKLAIVTRPAKKELLFPPAAGFTSSFFLPFLCSTLFCKYYFLLTLLVCIPVRMTSNTKDIGLALRFQFKEPLVG